VNLGALALIMISFFMIFGFMSLKADETKALLETDFQVMDMRKEFIENRGVNNLKLEDLEMQGEDS